MNLFKQAHILAKANVEKVGDYRVAFVWAIGELKEKELLVLTPVQSFKKTTTYSNVLSNDGIINCRYWI